MRGEPRARDATAPRAATATAALALTLSILTCGSITVATEGPGATTLVETVEVPLGQLAAGSAVGVNATNGSVNIANSLLLVSTDAFYLNNTNATGAYYAKLVLFSSSGVGNVVALAVGIDNGTRTDQIKGALGSLTQTSGAYVRLEPGSVNKLYVSQDVVSLLSTTTIQFEVRLADDEAESAFYTMRARVTLS